MTTFSSEALWIHSTRLGRTIQFEGGKYETSDPDEIRLLRRRRDVVEVEDLKADTKWLRGGETRRLVDPGALADLEREHDEDDFGPDAT